VAELVGYQDFVRARAGHLFQTAYFMCGNWHDAQDLVQTSLAKMYVSWHRVEKAENLDAYARTVMLRTYLSHRRLKRSGELPVDDLGPAQATLEDQDLRLTLVSALRQLPPRNRAVVVLRYLEGHSNEEIARITGSTVAGVKSRNTRSLARLRELLGGDRDILFTP
jgi:RNA polymerase sigma-70 factor (sigma-E family)